MTSHPTTLCKGPGCGKPVIWAAITKEDGTPGKVPLDPRATCFEVVGSGAAGPSGGVNARRAPQAYVSHFATCRDASRFSGPQGAKPSDEIADLRERLQKALDENAVLKEQLRRRQNLFDRPAGQME